MKKILLIIAIAGISSIHGEKTAEGSFSWIQKAYNERQEDRAAAKKERQEAREAAWTELRQGVWMSKAEKTEQKRVAKEAEQKRIMQIKEAEKANREAYEMKLAEKKHQDELTTQAIAAETARLQAEIDRKDARSDAMEAYLKNEALKDEVAKRNAELERRRQRIQNAQDTVQAKQDTAQAKQQAKLDAAQAQRELDIYWAQQRAEQAKWDAWEAKMAARPALEKLRDNQVDDEIFTHQLIATEHGQPTTLTAELSNLYQRLKTRAQNLALNDDYSEMDDAFTHRLIGAEQKHQAKTAELAKQAELARLAELARQTQMSRLSKTKNYTGTQLYRIPGVTTASDYTSRGLKYVGDTLGHYGSRGYHWIAG